MSYAISHLCRQTLWMGAIALPGACIAFRLVISRSHDVFVKQDRRREWPRPLRIHASRCQTMVLAGSHVGAQQDADGYTDPRR